MSNLGAVHGIQVWAAIKWISITLGNTDPNYLLDVDAIPSLSHQDLCKKCARRYAVNRVKVPLNNIPLLIRSMALLDAYTLKQCFFAWRKYTRRMKDMKTVMLFGKLKRTLCWWHDHTQYQRRIAASYNL